jgi:anti-anti-sigma regulatory factor
MSNLFASQFRLHVYLSEHPDETGGLDRLHSSIIENADQDVVVDFASVCEFNQQEIAILLSINKLLTQAGHQLVLQSIAPEIKASFAALGIAHVFKYTRDRDTQSNMPDGYH